MEHMGMRSPSLFFFLIPSKNCWKLLALPTKLTHLQLQPHVFFQISRSSLVVWSIYLVRHGMIWSISKVLFSTFWPRRAVKIVKTHLSNKTLHILREHFLTRKWMTSLPKDGTATCRFWGEERRPTPPKPSVEYLLWLKEQLQKHYNSRLHCFATCIVLGSGF